MNKPLVKAMFDKKFKYMDLAKAGGWSYSSVRFWVLGERVPSIENARKIEKILGAKGLAKEIRTP